MCMLYSRVISCQLAMVVDCLSQVVSHKDYKSREGFEAILHQKLIDDNIDIVCLAGFMRILTGN